MNLDFFKFVSEVWHDKPVIIVLCLAGVFIFVLLVIDTYLHRKKRKERHRITRFH